MSTDTTAAGTSDETAAANSATEERGGAALEPLFVYGVKQGTIHSRRLQKLGFCSVFMADLQGQSHAILLTFWPTSSADDGRHLCLVPRTCGVASTSRRTAPPSSTPPAAASHFLTRNRGRSAWCRWQTGTGLDSPNSIGEIIVVS